jgi:two-component system sensor histidine kinase YesM
MLATSSLRQKLIFTSVICLLIPLLITLSFTNFLSRGVLKNRAIQNSLYTLGSLELQVSSIVDDMLYVSNYIQFDGELNALLKELNEPLTDNQKALIQRRITERLESVTNLLSKMYVTILMNEGASYSNYPLFDYNPASFRNEPWFDRLPQLQGYETYWAGTEPNYLASEKQENPFVVTIARTVKIFSEPQGYFFVSLSERVFREIFLKASGLQTAFMTDSEGTILSHPDAGMIRKSIPMVSNSGSSSDVVRIDGLDYLLVNRIMPYSNWRLVSLTPYKEAVGQIDLIQKSSLIAQLLIYSFFLVVLAALVRQLTKPLSELGRVAGEVEGGNLAVRSGIRGSNEIGKLGRSFDIMLERIEEMLEQVRIEQATKRKFELAMLQAQINPHFLFNILNSIRVNIWLKGDRENAELISGLAALLRMTINNKNEFVPLYYEIEIVVHYMDLMNMRQKQRTEYEVMVEEHARLVEVPRFFIQPLIENAYIHGFANGGGRIKIAAVSMPDYLVVTVQDNGRGMTAEQVHQLYKGLGDGFQERAEPNRNFTGIGLKIVYDRMRIIYGPRYRLEIESAQGEGTLIRCVIPTGGIDHV